MVGTNQHGMCFVLFILVSLVFLSLFFLWTKGGRWGECVCELSLPVCGVQRHHGIHCRNPSLPPPQGPWRCPISVRSGCYLGLPQPGCSNNTHLSLTAWRLRSPRSERQWGSGESPLHGLQMVTFLPSGCPLTWLREGSPCVSMRAFIPLMRAPPSTPKNPPPYDHLGH